MTTDRPSRSLDDLVTTLTADTNPYLSCDDCFDQICAYVEKVVAEPLHEHPAMERHLQACPACADEAAAILELLNADAALRGAGAVQA